MVASVQRGVRSVVASVPLVLPLLPLLLQLDDPLLLLLVLLLQRIDPLRLLLLRRHHRPHGRGDALQLLSQQVGVDRRAQGGEVLRYHMLPGDGGRTQQVRMGQCGWRCWASLWAVQQCTCSSAPLWVVISRSANRTPVFR